MFKGDGPFETLDQTEAIQVSNSGPLGRKENQHEVVPICCSPCRRKGALVPLGRTTRRLLKQICGLVTPRLEQGIEGETKGMG